MALLRTRSKLIDLGQPVVMGILNLTPDSFYDGGKYSTTRDILSRVETMVEEGITILDIGAMSSRPSATIISLEEEVARLYPHLDQIMKLFPHLTISIDTVHGEVVKRTLDSGVEIINDISAGKIDDSIIDIVANYQASYVLMHMQGIPNSMQNDPNYQDVCKEILSFFIQKISQLKKRGIQNMIIDPGFGFGKTVEHNYQILRKLNVFHILDSPILIGLSRKSMIYKPLGITSQEALNGTTALHMLALQNGARILRAHDVKEANEAIRLWQLYKDPTSTTVVH